MWLLDLLGSRPFLRLKEMNMNTKKGDLKKLVEDLTKAYVKEYTDKVVRSQPHLFYYSDYLLNKISKGVKEHGAKGVAAGKIRKAIESSVTKHISLDSGKDKDLLKSIFEGKRTRFRRFLIKYSRTRGGVMFSSHNAARKWASGIKVEDFKPFAGDRIHLGHVESVASSRYRQSINSTLGDPYNPNVPGSGLWLDHGTKLDVAKTTAQIQKAYDINAKQARATALKLNNQLKNLLAIENSARFDRSYRDGSIHAELTVHVEVPEAAKENLKGEKAGALSKFITTVEKDILSIKASKSINNLIDDALDSIFIGKAPKSVKVSSTRKSRKKLKAPLIKVVHPQVPKAVATRKVQAQMSPIALRTLLNTAIAETIKTNMGKGRAYRKLNYRTGRFAKNVTIENVVPERNGAVVAFYSYMKNPYSTFAPGGAQYDRGPSRDPNLLIKKSMRQIAAAAAVTRFFPQES